MCDVMMKENNNKDRKILKDAHRLLLTVGLPSPNITLYHHCKMCDNVRR